MEKVLEIYNWPRSNKNELENFSRLITSKGIKSVIKNLPMKKKSPGSNGCIGEFYQTIKEELIPTLFSQLVLNPNPNSFQIFPKKQKGRNIPQILLQGQHYPDTKTREGYY